MENKTNAVPKDSQEVSLSQRALGNAEKNIDEFTNSWPPQQLVRTIGKLKEQRPDVYQLVTNELTLYSEVYDSQNPSGKVNHKISAPLLNSGYFDNTDQRLPLGERQEVLDAVLATLGISQPDLQIQRVNDENVYIKYVPTTRNGVFIRVESLPKMEEMQNMYLNRYDLAKNLPETATDQLIDGKFDDVYENFNLGFQGQRWLVKKELKSVQEANKAGKGEEGESERPQE